MHFAGSLTHPAISALCADAAARQSASGLHPMSLPGSASPRTFRGEKGRRAWLEEYLKSNVELPLTPSADSTLSNPPHGASPPFPPAGSTLSVQSPPEPGQTFGVPATKAEVQPWKWPPPVIRYYGGGGHATDAQDVRDGMVGLRKGTLKEVGAKSLLGCIIPSDLISDRWFVRGQGRVQTHFHFSMAAAERPLTFIFPHFPLLALHS